MTQSSLSFAERVWALCAKIPPGRVTTYREIAHALGTTAYRAIGQALKKNPFSPDVPCHRVVCSDGSLGGFSRGSKKKGALLAAEGVRVQAGRIVDFDKRLFRYHVPRKRNDFF